MASKPLLRRPPTWIIAVPVAIVIIVVGGLVAINLIQGDPDPELSFTDLSTPASDTTQAAADPTTAASDPSVTTAVSAATDGSIEGNWAIATGSRAGYRVPESLFGQSTEAVGRTTDVTGGITIDGTQLTAGNVTVDLTTVTSDRSQRDNQFQGRIMNTSEYPTATFTLTSPVDLGQVPADQVEMPLQVNGTLDLHDTTNDVTADITARLNGANIEVVGTIPVTFSDYGISDPSFGPAQVGDDGTIEFALVLAKG